MITTKTLESHFNFIADSKKSIDELKSVFPEYSKFLDYTPESLKKIDEIIEKNIEKAEDISWPIKESKPNKEEISLIVNISYYLADVVIRNLNAEWIIDKNQKSKTYTESVLKFSNSEECYNPLRVSLACAKNHKKLYDNYMFWEQRVKGS